MRDYYHILGIPATAAPEDIKKAYRKLAKKYHPDMNGGDRHAASRFEEITEAYETLSDEAGRSQYDLSRDPGKGRSAGRKVREAKTHGNPGAINYGSEFEKFFGFHPDTRDPVQGGEGKNPFDTAKIFQAYFNPKRK